MSLRAPTPITLLSLLAALLTSACALEARDDEADPGQTESALAPIGGTSPTPVTASRIVNASIPDGRLTGISSTLVIPGGGTVKTASVTVDIRHTYIGDLQVSLTHGGITRLLHNNEGGGTDDISRTYDIGALGFAGAPSNGDWTLRVVDTASLDVGTFRSWRLDLGVIPTAGSTAPVRYTNANSLAIPDNSLTGVASAISVPATATASKVAAEIAIRHTYIGDLTVSLAHAGQTWVIHNRVGSSADNLFTTVPLPAAAPGGTWTLRVVDGAGQDTGTLDAWSIVLTP